MPIPDWRALLFISLAALSTGAAATAPSDADAARCFELREKDAAAALAMADAALRIPDLEFGLRIKMLACLGGAAANVGQAARAEAAVAEVDALLATRPMPAEFMLRALSNSGATLHTLGRIQPALQYYARAYEAARESESDVSQVVMLGNVATIHDEALGAHAEAESYYARAAEVQRRIDKPNPVLPYNRGMNFRRMGELDRALASFAESERIAGSMGRALVLQRARAERIALEARRRGDFTASTRAELLAIAGEQRSLDASGAVLTLLHVSEGALRNGAAADALAQALAARELLPPGAYRVERREALEAELAARQALGDWRQALAVSQELRELEAASLHSEGLSGLATLQAKLQDTRSTEELQRMREQRRIETMQLEHAARLRNAFIVAFAVLALLAAAFIWYQRRVTARLHRLSSVDGLTGLLNRSAASEQLQREEPVAVDGKRRSVVFLIDIDHFKARNDRHGHAAGDAVLALVAQQLRASSRPGDVVARWGGEEFLVGCRNLDLASASAVAERLRAAIASLPLPETGGQDAPLSVSIGFACHPFFPDASGNEDWQEAVSLADRALYAAKHGGRNAWVGLWGRAEGQATMDAVAADPARHAELEVIDIVASRHPVYWQPLPGNS